MADFTTEEVLNLVQIARDARSGTTFLERMGVIADSLKKVVPFTNLATMMVNTATNEAPAERHVYHASSGSADLYVQYGAHYWRQDPVFPWGAKNKGVVTLLSHHVPDSFHGSTEYSKGFLEPGDIRHILGVNLPMPDGWTMIYSVQRAKECPDFTAKDVAAATILLPDLQRAAWGSLVQEQLERAAPTPSTTGIAVFGVRGDLFRIDETAKALLGDLLVDGVPSDELLEGVRLLGDPRRAAGRWSLEATHRVRAGGWIHLTFARTSDAAESVVVVVRQLREGEETFEAEALRAGLSPREREVARLAARGDGNREIAFALGVSPLTVKHQLRSIFRKTGTTSRTELTALLLAGRRRGS